jgi:hypothetical protein
MAFDIALADRIRKQIGGREGFVEKKMFGGLAFLLNGNMACGVHGEELIVRIDPDQTEQALSDPHARPFDMSGRPMKGWILVKPAGVETDEALAAWIRLGEQYAGSLPPK